MNKKKKPNIKRPDFKVQLAVVQKKLEPIAARFSPFWDRLPAFHQKALMVLLPVTLVLVLLPSGNQEVDSATVESISPTMIPADEMQRQTVSLNLEGLSEQEDAIRNAPSPYELEQEKSAEEITEVKTSPQERSAEKWHDYKIKEGDTLYQVFRKNNLSLTELNKVLKVEGADKPLSNVKKGQLFRFKLNTRGDLDIIQIEREGQAVMYFRMSDGNFGRSK
ncbi:MULTISPECIES: LysM-like peptidoglycan-binding domain-containing protein [Aliivibrio]|jgi:hypothetical protein|uniref:LysM-like peptidoglycan-binding domain-containing protein n=1 Tax=Aliivibrio TaxID=511678 RepID=UPI00039B2635|nr:LysM-like peptidoglycan-binding domain-containing protein [Aliivibrio logei]